MSFSSENSFDGFYRLNTAATRFVATTRFAATTIETGGYDHNLDGITPDQEPNQDQSQPIGREYAPENQTTHIADTQTSQYILSQWYENEVTTKEPTLKVQVQVQQVESTQENSQIDSIAQGQPEPQQTESQTTQIGSDPNLETEINTDSKYVLSKAQTEQLLQFRSQPKINLERALKF